MQFAELAVAVGKIELDGPIGLAPAASDFRDLVFEAADDIDARAAFHTRHRIHDRLAALFDIARHFRMRAALFDIHGEIDIREHRIVALGHGRGEHCEHGRAGRGVLPAHDAKQRIALCVIRTLVHNRQRLAIAHMHGPGPFEDARDAQAIELRIAMKALVDLDADHGLAIAMRRQPVELTRTTVRTIAIAELAAVNSPLNAHRTLPKKDDGSSTTNENGFHAALRDAVMASASLPVSSARWSNSISNVPTPCVSERRSMMRPCISESGICASTESQPFQPSRESKPIS